MTSVAHCATATTCSESSSQISKDDERFSSHRQAKCRFESPVVLIGDAVAQFLAAPTSPRPTPLRATNAARNMRGHSNDDPS
jgi:hypothetical protein